MNWDGGRFSWVWDIGVGHGMVGFDSAREGKREERVDNYGRESRKRNGQNYPSMVTRWAHDHFLSKILTETNRGLALKQIPK